MVTPKKDPALIPQTVLRDHRGRLIKGSAPLSRAGGGARGRLTFRHLVRSRMCDEEDGEDRMLRVVENLERMAMGDSNVNEKVQLGAATIIARLCDGKKAFDHSGDDELRTVETAGGVARNYSSPEAVREQQSALAAAMGCRVDQLKDVLDAALAWRNAQEEIGE